MYSQTKATILDFLKGCGQGQVKELVQQLGITQAAVHRALNQLMAQGLVEKRGKPPKVFYFLCQNTPTRPLVAINDATRAELDQHYLYVTPTGHLLTGLDGFLMWMKNTQNKQKPENCIQDYLGAIREANSHRCRPDQPIGQLIDATSRFQQIFIPCHLDKVYYEDFYSLIKFGKTKLGQLVLHGKQSQNSRIIKDIAATIAPSLNQLIANEAIDAVAWAPHSIPRKLPFLKEIERHINLKLPKIECIKVYGGAVPVAQKSLSKLEERIQNARETIVVSSAHLSAPRVLLIDDAVGSGATLNEIAHKLKDRGASHVIGYAIVGSYKGFEVIKEV
jgi:predicted DNA-binding transcriptional regulator